MLDEIQVWAVVYFDLRLGAGLCAGHSKRWTKSPFSDLHVLQDFGEKIKKNEDKNTVREFKNNQNKKLPSCDLYFLKADGIWE